jgi:hypothetical protein
VARGLLVPIDSARRARRASAHPLVVCALPAGTGPRSERAARAGRRTGRTKRRQTPNKERRANSAANSPRVRGVPNLRAGRPHASRSACVRAPARGARPTRRRGASERGSCGRRATDGTNETMPNPQRRAPSERGRGLTVGARRADSQHAGRPTARAALGVRLRARSWCAPYPPARGLGARERRARGDGRDERNDCKPPTKSEERRANAAAVSSRARGTRTPSTPAGRLCASRSACVRAP